MKFHVCCISIFVPVLLLGACKDKGATTPRAPVVSAPDTPASATGNAFLYEIAGTSGTTYLFGTYHVGGKEHVHADVIKRLELAPTFIMEMDLDINPVEAARFIMLPSDQSLRDSIPADKWPALVHAVSGLIPEIALARMRPWAVSMFIIRKYLPQGELMDLALHNHAKAAGKKLYYLETLEQQMQALAKSVTPEDLLDTLAQLDQIKPMLEHTWQAYLRGDEHALSSILFDTQWMTTENRDVLLTQRNRNWLPMIERQIKNGGAFIAMGAGHLLGDEGVPSLLRQRGYSVTPVTVPKQ